MRCKARSSPRLPMLCAITCTLSAPQFWVKSHQKVRDRLLAAFDARFVGGVSGDAAPRGPTEERRRAWHLEVESNLGGADGRLLERHVKAMQEDQCVGRLAALTRGFA